MKTIALLGGKLIFTDTPPRPPEDALWLAASMPMLPRNSRVMDAGCGSGIAGLALLHHQPTLQITAVDIDEKLTARVQQHAQMNQRHLEPITADVRHYTPASLFTAVICNPPFHAAARGHQSTAKGLARTLHDDMLTQWLQSFTRVLTEDGIIHLVVHSACREEIEAFAQQYKFSMAITPLVTQQARGAKRLLMTLRRGEFSVQEQLPLKTYEEELRTRILKNAARLT